MAYSERNKEHYIVTQKNDLRFKVRKDSLIDMSAVVDIFCE